MASDSHAQADPVVCSEGSGSFEAAFRTGVKVEVGAARRDGLATRMCQGTLRWDKNSLVVVPSATEVDIDALGVDMGLGTPVVTFQVKQAESDCCSTLLIYSLQKPPKLLRTISGGGSYITADRSLSDHVEIWTSDASSLKDFESPPFRRPETAPAVVLRFEHGRLLDAGSEFQNYFDEAIADARSKLTPEDLRGFKASDGRTDSVAHFSAEEQRESENLQATKLRVLQIVWSYLYSGREQDAWNALSGMWPAADFERIKAEIVRTRSQGVLAQTDGVSTAIRSTANTAIVFDLRKQSPSLPVQLNNRRHTAVAPAMPASSVVPPVPIFIAHLVPDAASTDDFPATGMLDLTIDAAGKVRTVSPTDPTLDAFFKDDTAGWKFIPAMDGNQAVASRIYMVVSPKR